MHDFPVSVQAYNLGHNSRAPHPKPTPTVNALDEARGRFLQAWLAALRAGDPIDAADEISTTSDAMAQLDVLAADLRAEAARA